MSKLVKKPLFLFVLIFEAFNDDVEALIQKQMQMERDLREIKEAIKMKRKKVAVNKSTRVSLETCLKLLTVFKEFLLPFAKFIFLTKFIMYKSMKLTLFSYTVLKLIFHIIFFVEKVNSHKVLKLNNFLQA